jgi:hypothetical protein
VGEQVGTASFQGLPKKTQQEQRAMSIFPDRKKQRAMSTQPNLHKISMQR